MKIVVAVLLNALLLVVLLPWLRRQWRQTGGWMRAALVLGLGSRLAVGAATGHHLVRDAHYLSDFGTLLSDQLWAEPVAALRSFWGDEIHFDGYELVFHGMSNTYFFAKIVAVLNLASVSTTWINALYFSLFSFVGAWQLAKAVWRTFPKTPAAAPILALLLWPSVVFWSSGITKEAVVLGSGTWLLALFIEVYYGTEPVRARARRNQLVGLAVLTLVHFKMRYFFAIPLLGALGALVLLRLLKSGGIVRGRMAQTLVLAAVLGTGVWVATEVSVAFRLHKMVNQVMRIYYRQLAASAGKPHYEYPNLRPTAESILQHVPQAIGSTLTRPWLGESSQRQYIVAGLENALLMVLLAGCLVASLRGKASRLPFGLVMALLVHCLVLAVQIGLTTPNLGTMHRYRTSMLPYLLLLVLQNDYAAAAFRKLRLGSSPSATTP